MHLSESLVGLAFVSIEIRFFFPFFFFLKKKLRFSCAVALWVLVLLVINCDKEWGDW